MQGAWGIAELLGSSLLGGGVVLLGDSLQDDSQAGNGSQHHAQSLSLQGLLRGQLSQSHDLVHGQDLAVHEATLDGELLVTQLLGVLVDDSHGGDGVGIAGGQRSGTVQNGIQLVQADVLHSEAGQGVLNNTVLDALLTQLDTQSGILSNGDTLVVDQNTGVGALQLLGQSGDNGLLLRQNLCVRHLDSPPTK